MPFLLDLPSEILVQIVQHVNTNGDLARLRQTSFYLNEIAEQQTQQFLDALCRDYGITSRVLHLYFSQTLGKGASYATHPKLGHVIALDHFLRSMEVVAMDVDRAALKTSEESDSYRTAQQSLDREMFLLFAVLSRLLSSSRTVVSLNGTVLAPCSSRQTFAPKVLSDQFVHILEHEFTLSELESIISAINICATRLWSSVFLFRPKDSTVNSFASLSGYSFNTDQAILTEHAIWKGPGWVARVLKRYGSEGRGHQSSLLVKKEFDDPIVKEGVWKGSRENGALLAANGVARLLWKERQQKIEQGKRNNRAQPETITEMHTNPAVWRGSSGEL